MEKKKSQRRKKTKLDCAAAPTTTVIVDSDDYHRVLRVGSVKPEDSTSSPETQFQPAQSSPLTHLLSIFCEYESDAKLRKCAVGRLYIEESEYQSAAEEVAAAGSEETRWEIIYHSFNERGEQGGRFFRASSSSNLNFNGRDIFAFLFFQRRYRFYIV